MFQKLKQNTGETLIETMFSLLVMVICMGILCSSVLAAVNINHETREMDETYAEELAAAESKDAANGTVEGRVLIDFAVDEDVKIDVTLYGAGNEESPYISYEMEGGT